MKEDVEWILEWINDHLPVWCALCRSVYFKKDMSYHKLSWSAFTGEVVPLCEECRKNVFEPFSRKEDV